MDSVKSQNKKYLNKALVYNRRRMILTMATVILAFVLSEIILHIPLFAIENRLFQVFILLMSVIEIFSYLSLFVCLNTGNRLYRYLYWVGFFTSVSMMLYPISCIFSNLTNGLTYILLLIIMGVKCLVLFRQGQYLFHNPNAQYIYDRILFVDDMKKEKDVKPKKKPVNKNMPTIRKGSDGIPVYYQDSSYQKISFRLAALIYGTLMLYPVIIQIFHNLFVSFDFQSNFALRGMFMACVISALVWTIAIFYLYYNQPQSRTVILFCWVVEIIRIIYSSVQLFGFFQSDNYPLRAFILFIFMDLLRYIGLFYYTKMVFSLEIPLSQDNE